MNPPDDAQEWMCNNGYETYVMLPLPGYIFSNESQAFRDRMEGWFMENNLLVGYDVDFLYCDGREGGPKGNYDQLNSIAVWFKDSKLAILFKLIFA